MRAKEILHENVKTIYAWRIGTKPCEHISMRNASASPDGLNSIIAVVVNKPYKWVINKYEIQIFGEYGKYKPYNGFGSSKYSNMGFGLEGLEPVGRSKIETGTSDWLSFPQKGMFLAKCIKTFTKEELNNAAQEILPKKYKRPLAALWKREQFNPDVRKEFLRRVIG